MTTEYQTDYNDSGDDILNRLTVDWLMAKLDEEEREILDLWLIKELNFEEIGQIIGMKYRGRVLTGSAIRYHKDRILDHLRQYAGAVGLDTPRLVR